MNSGLLEVTATRFKPPISSCTDLISNTHEDSHESRPCMLPALHFKDAMLKWSWVRPKLSNIVLPRRSLIRSICSVFLVPPLVVPSF